MAGNDTKTYFFYFLTLFLYIQSLLHSTALFLGSENHISAL